MQPCGGGKSSAGSDSLRPSLRNDGGVCRVSAARPDGSLDVTDADGIAARLPVTYVTAHVELGYATTTARSQGVTADVTHNLVGPGTAREDLYVAMSRGRAANPRTGTTTCGTPG